MDATRIADLKRRLQADPTSIAFAQLAEEYRRAGQFDEAVTVCREGLQRHPGYLSARVTLGRALQELEQTTDAEREFEYVLRTAPDNLPALRGLAEIHEKKGNLQRALGYYRRALEMAHYDPDLDETVRAIAEELDRPHARANEEGLSFEQARKELLDAPSRVPLVPPKTPVDFAHVLQSLGYEPNAPAPPAVEAWLSGQVPAPPAPIEPAAVPPATSSSDALDADFLAQLEQDLRRLEQRDTPAGSRESAIGSPDDVPLSSPSIVTGDSRLPTSERIVLAALEQWLQGVTVRRHQRARA